jgi:DNA-binding transcriptional ArsR family regulator
MSTLSVLDRAEAVETALTPARRRLLRLLEEPASATELAQRVGLPRQQVNYHVRALERHGLVTLVAERRKRGLTERVVRATGRFLVDPGLLAAGDDGVAPRAEMNAADALSADALAYAAAGAVHDVGALTREGGGRARTVTLTAELRLGSPARMRAFLDDLAALVARYDEPGAERGRPYRVVGLVYPTPKEAR